MQKMSKGPLKGRRLIRMTGFNLFKSCAIFLLMASCSGVKAFPSTFSIMINLKYCSRSFLNEKNPSLAMCLACLVYISARWTAVLPWARQIQSKAFLLMQLQRVGSVLDMIARMEEASIVVLCGQLIVDKSCKIPIFLSLSENVLTFPNIGIGQGNYTYIFLWLYLNQFILFSEENQMTKYGISTFNLDDISLQGQGMDEDRTYFRLIDPRYPRRYQIGLHTFLANIVSPQRQAIFHDDEDSPEHDSPKAVPPIGAQLESREDIGNSTITEQPSRLPSNSGQENAERHDSTRYKRNGEPQINKSGTKNYLSFVWKKIVHFLNSQQAVSQSHWWEILEMKSPSLQVFSQLFAEEGANPHLRRLFQGKSIYRQIMLSSIDAHKKKVYVSYLRSIYRGFLRKKLEYLK